MLTLDLLYSDLRGGQRSISRFTLRPVGQDQWFATIARHFALDGPAPADAAARSGLGLGRLGVASDGARPELSAATPDEELATLLRHLEPHRQLGQFVFCTVQQAPAYVEPLATIQEDEGLTVVVEKDVADGAGLKYDFVAAMITLGVVSPLHAVGLTAAVSAVLADAGISCNVMAGHFHDHLFVPVDRAEDTLELLHQVSRRALGPESSPSQRPAAGSSAGPSRPPGLPGS